MEVVAYASPNFADDASVSSRRYAPHVFSSEYARVICTVSPSWRIHLRTQVSLPDMLPMVLSISAHVFRILSDALHGPAMIRLGIAPIRYIPLFLLVRYSHGLGHVTLLSFVLIRLCLCRYAFSCLLRLGHRIISSCIELDTG